jgi:glycosyltransferase involved in cell wall biosynthesis
MNILEIVDDLGFGGAERVVTNLAIELSARGHTIHIVCLRSKGVPSVSEERFAASGVQITELNKKDGFSLFVLLRLVRIIRAEGIDLIHTHNPLVHHYGVLASRLTGRPVVNTVHGTATLKMQKWAHALFRVSCHFSSRVVSVCQVVAEACDRELGIAPHKSAVIPNGIQFDEFMRIPAPEPNGHFVFGTIGRLVPVKDHVSLLQSFARLRQCAPCSRLEILGDGELESDLKRLAAELGLETTVTFRGFSRDIAGFLAGIHCFVLSSRSEGLPMSMLEAMAGGRPVVATSVGAVSEILMKAECGWLCRPGDVGDLRRAMCEATRAEDIAQRGRRARANVVDFYSATLMADKYIRLFQDVLTSNR